MSLRDRNAAQARRLMCDTASQLIADLGYDATTMSGIAKHAGVGSSTLYRYFPHKEALAMAALGEPGVMAATFNAHHDDGIDVALEAAVTALATNHYKRVGCLPLLAALLDDPHGPHAAVRAWLRDESQLLGDALAARLGLAAGDPHVPALHALIAEALRRSSSRIDRASSHEEVAGTLETTWTEVRAEIQRAS